MKILYDHQTFELQEFGGISRYFVELLRNKTGFQVELALKRSSNIYLDPNSPLCRGVEGREDAFERLLAGVRFRGKGRVHSVLRNLGVVVDASRVNRLNSLEHIGQGDFDVFHPTYYDPYFLGSIGDRPLVVTVFDMIHEVFPEYFRAGDRTSVHKRLLCEKAKRIIAISNSTKADLIRFFGIHDDKIDVVHLASSVGVATPRSPGTISTPAKYILFVGNRLLYKNFMFALRAITVLLHEDCDLFVVYTGPPFSMDEIGYLETHGIRDRVTHFSVDDNQLGVLYRNAELFVFPSLYEGFGIPLLEAFSCCCPVAASDTGVFREIAGDAALFFQPDDPNSIADAIRMVLDDQALRDEMVKRGIERNREFSWRRTTEQTLCTYEKT